MRRRTFLLSSAATLLLSACGGNASDSGEADPAQAAPIEGDENAAATLTFWAWAENIQRVVDLWNEKNPTQKVTLSGQAAGDELVAKFLTAVKAGNAPDILQVEYQSLPTLITNNALQDLTSVIGPVRSAFPEGTWNLTSFGGATYAVPQDVGPMMLFYREDIFEEMGLAVPATWEEFGALAGTVREKDSKRYLTTFSPGDAGWLAGFAQQAGANWWADENGAWKVTVDDPATRKMLSFWGGLVNSGAILGDPMYTPQWNSQMSDGTIIAWPSAVWGAGVLAGVAASSKGKWRMAPLPQWNAGERFTGFWGGSSTAVSASSKQKAQAAKFAKWMNTDPEALKLLVEIGLYPSASAGQTSEQLGAAPEFMVSQKDYYDSAAEIAKTARGFSSWGPNTNVTYGAFEDLMPTAVRGKSDLAAVAAQVQQMSVADLKKQGYQVVGG
ncbi:multiple sugar transport system substrate-binding protein [Streptosporangium becharense]|uniref:Multiple sugar transport system substrate-binding protein n=1 Tax=Streptosporangium becharense TaxID=1816182 RepID=A0A7W9MHB7_9ACTN|nr:sugar ABC transporter substrate-binding protein [Streptosporangium becharense]MBB2914783.1 multiple sugar transport system substrate-binding protein [Streptosporangium becharense]MBB5820406.1 multiple sugar transport system substrate-binding protein [Streptosporangium becharense]